MAYNPYFKMDEKDPLAVPCPVDGCRAPVGEKCRYQPGARDRSKWVGRHMRLAHYKRYRAAYVVRERARNQERMSVINALRTFDLAEYQQLGVWLRAHGDIFVKLEP